MKSKVRVAIAGVGNCASSLVQGVNYYTGARPEDRIPGLMHVNLGGYHVGDVEFVAAFDIDAQKVGQDLGQAIFAGQNNTYKFCEVPPWVSRCNTAPPWTDWAVTSATSSQNPRLFPWTWLRCCVTCTPMC